MSSPRQVGHRVRDAIAVFEQNKGKIVFSESPSRRNGQMVPQPLKARRNQVTPTSVFASEVNSSPPSPLLSGLSGKKSGSRPSSVPNQDTESSWYDEVMSLAEQVSEMCDVQLRSSPVFKAPETKKIQTGWAKTEYVSSSPVLESSSSSSITSGSSSTLHLQADPAPSYMSTPSLWHPPRKGVLDLINEARIMISDLMVESLPSPPPVDQIIESHSSLSSKSEIDRVRQLEEKNRKLQKENRELQRKLNESQLSEMSYIQQLNELQLAYTKIKHKIKLKKNGLTNDKAKSPVKERGSGRISSKETSPSAGQESSV